MDQLTLVELTNRHDPKGKVAKIAEKLTTKNEIFEDATFIEANDKTKHVFPQRVSEPSGSWGRINKGIDDESSETIQVEEHIGMLESRSTVDDRLLELADNKKEFRAKEDLAFASGMGKTMASALFYQNMATQPEAFNGFSARSDYASVGIYCLSAAGSDSGGMCSAYVIQWGDGIDGIALSYPKGDKRSGKFGFDQEDMGKQRVWDADNLPYYAWETMFKWKTGLVIPDPRMVMRIANIDIGTTDITTVMNLFIDAINALPGSGQNATIVVPRRLRGSIMKEASDKVNVTHTPENPWGRKWITDFLGVPIRIDEALVETETTVS